MQTQVVIDIVFAALVCIGIYHVGINLAGKLKETAQKKLETAAALNKALEVLAKSQLALEMRIAAEAERFNMSILELRKALDEAAKSQEKIMIGTTKACEAIAVTTERHRETVASLGKLLFGSGTGRDALSQPTEEDRDRLSAELAYRAQGHSPEAAQVLADAEIDRERSMPSL